MNVDGDITVYKQRVADACQPQQWPSQFANCKPSPKFKQGHPLPFGGVTLMTPLQPYPYSSGHPFSLLEQVTDELNASLDHGYVPVLPESFHVTGADLLARPHWQLGELDRHTELTQRALKMIANRCRSHARFAHWCFAGLSIFEHALVALLTPTKPICYDALVRLRASIYEDAALTRLGVKQPKPLMLHITLGYFTERLHELNPKLIVDVIGRADRSLRLAADSAIYEMPTLQLCRFSQMGRYSIASPSLKISLVAES